MALPVTYRVGAILANVEGVLLSTTQMAAVGVEEGGRVAISCGDYSCHADVSRGVDEPLSEWVIVGPTIVQELKGFQADGITITEVTRKGKKT